MPRFKELPEGSPKKGERWLTKDGRTVRVMADPIEGWVMYRYKGAMPGLLHANDWQQRFARTAV